LLTLRASSVLIWPLTSNTLLVAGGLLVTTSFPLGSVLAIATSGLSGSTNILIFCTHINIPSLPIDDFQSGPRSLLHQSAIHQVLTMTASASFGLLLEIISINLSTYPIAITRQSDPAYTGPSVSRLNLFPVQYAGSLRIPISAMVTIVSWFAGYSNASATNGQRISVEIL